MDTDLLLAILRALADHGVEYVLVGGAAMNVHGLIRTTEDVDLFLMPTEENIAALKNALRSVFDDPSVDDITADDLLGEYPAVRYYPPEGDLYLDLMTRLGSAFGYDDLDSELVEREEVPIRVATPATLVSMKEKTLRALDRQDAARLREAFELDDPGTGAEPGDDHAD